ncbi:hypothetical protein [Brevundimonas sp.]|nr:hypothetical protein [Brevundimonas sp.]
MRGRLVLVGALLGVLMLSGCMGTIQHRESGGHYCRADVRCPYGDF